MLNQARLARILCVAALAACCWQPAPAQSSGESRDLDAYRSELRRLSDGVARLESEPEYTRELFDSVPGELRVSTSEGEFTVPLQWVRRELGTLADKNSKEESKEQALSSLASGLAELAEHADGFAEPLPGEGADAALKDILSRREFRKAQGQSWTAGLRQRFAELLLWLFGSALGSLGDFPLLSRLFVWGVVALLLIVLVLWIYRLLGRSARREARTFAELEVPSHRPWESWLEESRKRASEGAWRDAIRLCYWAAISRLESIGRWPADRARTPREYLRLLPELGEERKRLGELTRGFELAWYAQQPAGEGDFQVALARAEELGCR
jgi:hypothetical protein